MYSESDCLGAIQLAGWIYGKDIREITVSEYRDTGFSPTYQTHVNRFNSWDDAKLEAWRCDHQVPSQLPQFFRSVAALRRARDLSGYPVTGLEYQNDLEISVDYHDVISPFRSWTHAKCVAGIHSETYPTPLQFVWSDS